jgi:hypothetical protein
MTTMRHCAKPLGRGRLPTPGLTLVVESRLAKGGGIHQVLLRYLLSSTTTGTSQIAATFFLEERGSLFLAIER